jgi:acyl-homoserine-lactone acylase
MPPISALALFALLGAQALAAPGRPSTPPPELWREVEIIRTAHGIPHIRAQNLRAGGYALGWLQCEDYAALTPNRLWATRGQTARRFGRLALDADFDALRERERAIATYHLLDQETRDFYDGFAAGVNRYIALHRAEFDAALPEDFSGYDVAALTIGDGPPAAKVRKFVAALNGLPADPGPTPNPTPSPNPDPGHWVLEPDLADPEEGSNAWALAPSRTRSGKAILLRNPHLAWSAGYYEAHLTVPGVVDFYGDFRIGGPLLVVGGFNRHLGWATTNSNSNDRTEIYALEVDTEVKDHYRLDGASLPITKTSRSAEYLEGETLLTETRESWSTPLGPVVHRTAEHIYVARTAGDGEYRAGQQFLRMMRATSHAEWLEAMRMRALVSQNFTYADRTGAIYILWNAAIPWLPHPTGGDTTATTARETGDVWTRYVPFEALPQQRNPKGGYLHNENDSPHYANVAGSVNIVNAYPNIEPPRLRLRSQLAIELIGPKKKWSLEDVVRLKHDYRMLLADRVKPDILRAVRIAEPSGEVARALDVLSRWDNRAAPDSRGAVLFALWWERYAPDRDAAKYFAQPWSEADPLKTPRGLADPARAVEAFVWAVEETARRYGRTDVTWGEVHRVRRGEVDVPVGGCPGALGCFRVMGFTAAADGKQVASTGDGWVLAVEFGDVPRAYSVLAYGQSARPESPWHADQAAMFARGEMKRVAFTESDVMKGAVTRYRPGSAP